MKTPRILFVLPLLLALAACGGRPAPSTTGVLPGEDLDLSLVHQKPDETPRRAVSADVVRKTEAEARALFGAPAALRREPPGEVWQYQAEAPRCTLLLFLYPDDASARLRVSHAQVLSRVRGQTVDDSDCLAALLKTTPLPQRPVS
ncbi:MAG: hypothetical protein OJJ21_10990 [Ferrovibrio sp.]|uniref:hypothetical protein n=1 Tax=Ferrovibrio sp. TaxID=1917215 RepID=UPI0026095BB7|nr:hypothetical protein [Ferrovibrio sp.]MCW0234115.1 hypothetical protein [Ferrovibrio sp.]